MSIHTLYLGDQLSGLCRLKGLFLALPRLWKQSVSFFRYQNLLGELYIPVVCILTPTEKAHNSITQHAGARVDRQAEGTLR